MPLFCHARNVKYPSHFQRNLLAGGCLIVLVIFVLKLGLEPMDSPDSFVHRLYHLIDQADRIVVYYPGNGLPDHIYKSSDRKDRDALKAAIHIMRAPLQVPTTPSQLAGVPWIDLYQGDKNIGRISNVYGVSIRCDEAMLPEVSLTNPDAWAKWFTDRGFADPRNENAMVNLSPAK